MFWRCRLPVDSRLNVTLIEIQQLSTRIRHFIKLPVFQTVQLPFFNVINAFVVDRWVHCFSHLRVKVCVYFQGSEVTEQVLHTVSKSSSLEEITLENAGLKS